MNTDPEPTDPQGSRRTDMTELADYARLLSDIKARIQAAQTKAVMAVNAEMIRLYWGIGRLLEERQAREGWGAAVIPRLANDPRNELPEVKGFSGASRRATSTACWPLLGPTRSRASFRQKLWRKGSIMLELFEPRLVDAMERRTPPHLIFRGIEPVEIGSGKVGAVVRERLAMLLS